MLCIKYELYIAFLYRRERCLCEILQYEAREVSFAMEEKEI